MTLGRPPRTLRQPPLLCQPPRRQPPLRTLLRAAALAALAAGPATAQNSATVHDNGAQDAPVSIPAAPSAIAAALNWAEPARHVAPPREGAPAGPEAPAGEDASGTPASGPAAPVVSAPPVAHPGPAASEPALAGAGSGEHGDHPGEPGATRSPMPFDVVRSIQFLQDQVARGNSRAIRVQAMLLRRFAPVFLRAEPAVWADNRNKRAAILLVLSGGPPELLSDLLAANRFDEPYRTLAEGALAYVGGDLDTARERLSAVDLDALEAGLAAQASLVLGQLEQQKDPEAAVRRLDRARLLAPGGLVEEAALRLEMLIVADLGRFSEADRLARQYFDRYARSSYAQNFEARFASLYAKRGKEDAATVAEAMADVTARLPDMRRQALFLGVARRALVDGNLALADLAAVRALSTGSMTDADRERARLYAAAATLGSAGGSPDKQAELAAIRRDALQPEDARLLDAARGVLVAIDRVPASGAPREPDASANGLPVFGRADRLLRDVANDLGNAPQ